ncbi:MAG TPA: uridine kinase [Candidatus Eisenbacteria bacterium]|nr:uridine kinase [Candidatus Eisenbacteria bacterium]
MMADRTRRCVLIGIAGGTGAGKTLVASSIVEALEGEGVALLEQDSYYRDLRHIPLGERETRNYDHPDAFDRDLLRLHLASLLEGRAIDMPVYDRKSHTRGAETRPVPPARVVVLDGILILEDPALRQLLDIKLYVDADPDIRFIRRLKRDLVERGRTLDQVIRQYEATVRPMHLQYVEPSKQHADLIIPGGGYNAVAIDLIVSKIRSLLLQPASR